ncbi:hypothetical protein [Jiangella gansuensis]|uniref:hypothetical protein n=1 Tax=Jiangella gansuensis TaxID=281473 RepID=UPI000478ED52|nr:hypothetical protein [Jiangella gansuensis]
MRRARQAAAVVATALSTALGIVALAPAPVSAGGPTSVLLVAPQHATSAALHHADPAYDELASALNPAPVAAEVPAPRSVPPGPMDTAVVATWMIHDIQPWRVDRVLLGDGGMPEWIHTVESIGAEVDHGAAGIWHRPADPNELMRLLKGLGLTGDIAPEALGSEEAPESGSAAAAGGGNGLGPAWALPAAVAGVVLGAAGERWLGRRRDRADGGRWQLVDVP